MTIYGWAFILLISYQISDPVPSTTAEKPHPLSENHNLIVLMWNISSHVWDSNTGLFLYTTVHSERGKYWDTRQGCPRVYDEDVAWHILRGIVYQVTKKGREGWVCRAIFLQRNSSQCHLVEPFFLQQSFRDLRPENPWWDWVHPDLVDPQFQGHDLSKRHMHLGLEKLVMLS